MDLGLKEKRAVVTAASQGLGLAIARELVREGCRVVISSRRGEVIQEVAHGLRQEFGVPEDRVYGYAADVTNPSDIQSLISFAESTLGGIDILVTNAGGPPPANFESTTDEMWYRAFELNLMSVVRLIRATIPIMKSQGGGKVLNVSSTSVKQPIPDLVLSNTIRTGVMALLKSLSLELANDGILFHNLAPGRIATERVEQLDTSKAERTGRDVRDIRAEEESKIPLGRYGTPEEFGKYAAFLLSDVNSYTTGDTVYVDGGLIRSL
jgi:3-oxoacyl-[acyl-carrier protein] reductase